MSNISTLYDKFIELVGTNFSSHTRIPNPEDLSQNPDQFLNQGWGFIYGGGTPDPEATPFCKLGVAHIFKVVFTREIVRLESNTTLTDTGQKAVLEDVLTLQKVMAGTDQLGIETSVINNVPGDIGQFQEVYNGRGKFISLEVDFIFTIWENY